MPKSRQIGRLPEWPALDCSQHADTGQPSTGIRRWGGSWSPSWLAEAHSRGPAARPHRLAPGQPRERRQGSPGLGAQEKPEHPISYGARSPWPRGADRGYHKVLLAAGEAAGETRV